MKQLLVLTDFTANAAHAASAALRLCRKLKAGLLLYHTVQYIPVIPDFSGTAYVTETDDMLFKESKLQLSKEVESLKSAALKIRGYHPEISCASGEGDLGNNINALSCQRDIKLVVMGGRSGGALEHLLTGSETAAVIRDARKPVLVIPETADLEELKKVVFATDFDAADVAALNYLLNMAQALGFQIEVVHVILPGDAIADIQSEIAFREYLNSLDKPKAYYMHLFGDDVGHILQDYCRETGAGLLAMIRNQHDFVSRVFGHSETKEAVAQKNLPVLIFPPAFEEHEF